MPLVAHDGDLDAIWDFVVQWEIYQARPHTLRTIQTIKQIITIVPNSPYPNIVGSYSLKSSERDLFQMLPASPCRVHRRSNRLRQSEPPHCISRPFFTWPIRRFPAAVARSF